MRVSLKSVFAGTLLYAIICFSIETVFEPVHDGRTLIRTGVKAIFQGIIMSLVFGYLLRIYISKREAKLIVADDILEPGETIRFESPANYFYKNGVEAGKIFITGERIIFRSRNYVFGKHPKSFYLENIQKIKPSGRLGLNNLEIIFDDGAKEKFSVMDKKGFMTQTGFLVIA